MCFSLRTFYGRVDFVVHRNILLLHVASDLQLQVLEKSVENRGAWRTTDNQCQKF